MLHFVIGYNSFTSSKKGIKSKSLYAHVSHLLSNNYQEKFQKVLNKTSKDALLQAKRASFASRLIVFIKSAREKIGQRRLYPKTLPSKTKPFVIALS